MNVFDLPVEGIRDDSGAQMRRDGVFADTVQEYANAMKEGAEFPPLLAFHDGDDYWLADGFHRIQAARQIDRETIRVEVRQGTRRDAILCGAGVNATHGLRRTQADKRNAVEKILSDPEWAKWSDREVARTCNVDHKTVARVRRELTGEIPTEVTYRNRHGSVSQMDVSARQTGERTSVLHTVLKSVSDDALIEECRRRGIWPDA